MALSKKTKIWLIVLSVPVVLVVGAIVGLKFYLTSERLKGMIVPRIEEATHRTVGLADISFTVFPQFGITVEGLTISNPQRPAFSHDRFLSLDKLILDVKILPLLRGNVVVNKIIIEHPVVNLEVSKEGVKNYKFVPAQPAAEQTSRTAEQGGMGALLLSNLELNNGELEFLNNKSDSRFLLKGINQIGSAEARAGEDVIHLSSDISIEKLSYGSLATMLIKEVPAKAKGQFSIDVKKMIFTFDSVMMHVKDLPLAMTGTMAIEGENFDLNMNITTPKVQMSQLLSLVPAEMLKAAKGLASSGDVGFSLTMKGTMGDTINPGVKGSFLVSNGKIQYASLPKSITNINVVGNFEKPQASTTAKGLGTFGIEKLSASLGNNDVSGNLHITNFDDPNIGASFSATMNLSEVKDFYPLEQGTEVTGIMKAKLSLQGKAKTPASIDASGNIEFQNVTIKTATSPRPLQNLNGTITFNNQRIESKQLTMNIGESDLNLSFTMNNYLGMVMKDAEKTGKPNASITLKSKQLRTADLISESSTTALSTNKQAKKEQQQSGFLPGFDIDANVTIGKLVTEKFEFDDARGSVAISNGVITLKNFSINAFQGSVQTKGTLELRDLKKRPFDLELNIAGVEAHSILPKFTSFGNNLFGKFTMNTKLKGELNDTLGLIKESLAGDGKVQISDGKLQGYPLMAKIADVTGYNDLRQVSFKNWSNTFTITNGRATINNLKVNAGQTDLLADGSEGLDGSMDLNVNVKLPGSVSDKLNLQGVGGELMQFFKDKDGRISLNFKVTGESTSPSVKLNTKAQEELAKQALQKKADEAKKKLEEEAKKKGIDVLKKLFKKP